MKRTIALLLSAIMLITLLSVPVSATDTIAESNSNVINFGFEDWSNSDPAVDFQRLGKFPTSYYFGKDSTVRNLIYPRLSELGEGYNGTYALKLGGPHGPVDVPGGSTGKNGYKVGFRFDTPGFIKNATEYTISMKLKKTQGELTTFDFGFQDDALDYSLNLVDSDFTGEWQEYTYTYTTDFGTADAAKTRAWVYFTYTAPQGGGTVLIDDVVIYETADTTATNLFPKGNFELICTANPVTEAVETAYHFTPLEHSDFERLAEASYETTSYDFPYVYGNKTEKQATAPRLVPEIGVNESHAMVLGGETDSAIASYYVRFRLKPGTFSEKSYGFSLNLKKLSGSVTSLNIGLIEGSVAKHSITLTDDNLSTDNYVNYSWVHTTSSAVEKAWTLVEIQFSSPEGGFELAVDDFVVYDLTDETKKNLFVIYDDDAVAHDASTFDQKVLSQTPIFDYAFNRNYGTADYSLPHIENVDESHTGDYCLAFGFEDAIYDDNDKIIGNNLATSFRLAEVGNAGGSYTIKFAAKLVGNARKSVVKIGGVEQFNILNSLQNSNGEWTELSFTYTDSPKYKSVHTYIEFTYYTTTPDSQSGLLIDSISITQNELGENAPNMLYGGNFEIINHKLTEIDWESESIFWGEDVFDLSFMNTLPKSVGAYGVSTTKGASFFLDTINEPSFNYFTDYYISECNLTLCNYLTEQFTAKNKNILLTVEDIVCNSDKTLKENWQDLLNTYATNMQLIAGNKFQGFYFDEPSMDFTAEDFLTVSQYCRTHFRKRVMVIHKAAGVNPEEDTTTDRAILNGESHKYVTDVGYWKYNSWDSASEDTLNAFKAAMTSGDFNPDVRKWIVPIVGRNHPCQTEEDICTLIEKMVYGAMEIPGFGGVGLYAMSYSVISVPKTGDGSNPLINQNSAQLLEDGIIWEDGENWKFIEANGSELIKRDPETGLANWNNCANLIEKIAADLYNTTPHNYTAINGVAVIEDTRTTVGDFAINAELPTTRYTVYHGDDILTKADTLSTGDKLVIATSTGTTEYIIAVKNDANCDGVIDARDIVCSKKASAGKIEFSTAQYAAMGQAETANPLNITAIAALRNTFMQ